MVKQTTIKMDLLSAQHSIWERLVRITKSEKIGNAYLFSGRPGSGKEGLAIKFAQFLNCNDADEQACDICPSCIRFKQLQHEAYQKKPKIYSIKFRFRKQTVF